MAQTREGARKIAAARIGVAIADYTARVNAGEKWCFRCREWHPLAAFGVDRHRLDGRSAACRKSKNSSYRERYVPHPLPPRVPGKTWKKPGRDGDRGQARGRVNYLIRVGVLPRPNELRCVDCGHEWTRGERRHEYDHYLGYAAEHHDDVEPVCTTCHAAREREVRPTHGR